MHDDRSSDGTFSQGAEAVSDRDLLAQFVRRSDERAYAEIVRRHGTLVLGVCRRVLRDRHAAEDAFQATFLVLARSAGRIRRRRSLAGWLHRVAYRVSMRALAESRRRKELAVPMETVSSHDDFTDVEQRYEQQLLDEELQDLPAKYREPLVLHHLQGLSRQQVAERLGMSLTAVDGRLKRGRKQLKMRLLRRGVELGAVLAVVTLGQSAIQAASLEPLFALATQTAAAAHAGSATPSTVSSQAARLAGKELTLMTGSTKLVATLGISAVVVTLIGLAGADARAVPAAQDHGSLPLLSTFAHDVTPEITDNALLAQAPEFTDPRASASATATTPDALPTTNNVPNEVVIAQLQELSRRLAALHESILTTIPEVNDQKQGLLESLGDLSDLVADLQSQTAGGPPAHFPSLPEEDVETRLPIRPPTLDYLPDDAWTERIREALDQRTTIEFPGNPLNDVAQYISELHDIPILLDEQTLLDSGISPEEEVSLVISNIRLRSALDLLLKNVAGVPLDYVVENEVLTITTREKADRILDTRVYNLRNLSTTYTPEEIALIVQSTIRPWTWRADEQFSENPGVSFGSDVHVDERFQASVEALPDALVVRQSQRIHREIVDLLHQLYRHDPESTTSALITAAVNERLDQVAGVAYAEMAWKTIVTAIALDHNLNVVFDEAAIGDRGLTGNEEVTIAVEDVTIRSILKLVLSQVGLTYVVADEVIQVTTPEVTEPDESVLPPTPTGQGEFPYYERPAPRTSDPPASTGRNTFSPATDDHSGDVSISGLIRVRGDAPALPPLVVAGDPNVRDSTILEADVPDESLIVGDENGLGNVFVWLQSAPDSVSIPAPPSEPLVIGSSGLQFVPHASLVRADQPIRLTNADPVVTNVRISPLRDSPFNVVIGARDLNGIPYEFDQPEQLPIILKDEIHPTRTALVLPLDHPFADLTDETGQFQIRQLPPGNYELTIWHERAGYLERSLPVTVTDNGPFELNLEFDVDRFLDR